MADSESSDKPAASATPKGTNIFQFLKDWGPVATLIIAVCYTFPNDAFDKWVNWKNHNTVTARAALTQIEELLAAKMIALQQFTSDPEKSDLVGKSFNIRSYNIIINNLQTFQAAIPQLSTAELYAIGSNLTLAGLLSDSLPFYREALQRSQNDDHLAFAAASREYGWTLFSNSQVQNVVEARQQYINALRTVGKRENFINPIQFLNYLSELGLWEMSTGDWKCGVDVIGYADTLFDQLSLRDASAIQVKQYFDNGARMKVKAKEQPEKGCIYVVPRNEWLD